MPSKEEKAKTLVRTPGAILEADSRAFYAKVSKDTVYLVTVLFFPHTSVVLTAVCTCEHGRKHPEGSIDGCSHIIGVIERLEEKNEQS